MRRGIYSYQGRKYSDWAFYLALFELLMLSFSYELATLSLVTGWAVYLYKGFKYGFDWKSNIIDIPIAVFAVFALFSVAAAPDKVFSFYNYWNLVGRYLLTYYLVVQTFPRERRQAVESLTYVLLLGFVIVVIYGLLQGFFGLGLSEENAWVDQGVFANLTARVYSSWYNPNILGGYLDIMLGVIAGLFIANEDRRLKLVLGVIFLLGLAVLSMTYARGAMLALVLALGVYTLLKKRRLFLGLILILAVICILNPLLLERFIFTTQKLDTSAEMRLAFWTSTWAMIKDHPLLGIGWGQFYEVYPHYDYYMQGQYIKIVHAHNLYLNLWAETGIFGLAAYLIAFGMGIYRGFRAKIKDFDGSGALCFGIALGLLAMAFNGFTDFVLFNVELSMLAWFLLAVVTVLYQRRRI